MSSPRRRARNGQFTSGAPKNAPTAAPYRPTANPAYAAGMQQLRQSNAAGTHADKRDRRARTRGAQLRRDLDDQQ